MQNKELTNYIHWQLGAALVSTMTMTHIFAHGPQPHTAHSVHSQSHNGLEREREVHPSHGNHGVRARYAVVAGT